MITTILSIVAYFFIDKNKKIAYFLWLIVNVYYGHKTKEFVFYIQALFCIYYLFKKDNNECKN
jgi:nicotinamide riboside transporter PnuC